MLSYLTFIKYIFALHSACGVAGDPHDRTVECVADRQGDAALFFVDVTSRTLAAILIKRMGGKLMNGLFLAVSFHFTNAPCSFVCQPEHSQRALQSAALQRRQSQPTTPPGGGGGSPFPPIE